MKTTEDALRAETEPAAWQDGKHERRGTGAAAGAGGGASPTATALLLQVLRLSKLPERLPPVR